MESMRMLKVLLFMSLLGFSAPPGACGPQTACSLHLVIGLDVIDYQQSDLPGRLDSLLRTVFSLRNTSCVDLAVSLTIQTVAQDGQSLFEARLRDYQEGVLRRLRQALALKRTYLNEAFLGSFLSPVSSVEASGKVLLLFTDGLDEDLRKLQDMSANLRQEGWFNALLTVAVNNSTDQEQIKQIEFGRRARHGVRLSLDMPDMNGVLAQELLAVSERTCCHECFCSCVGPAGQHGPRGILGKKGRKGAQGLAGDPGHSGTTGEQGPLGLPGSRGDQGCQGQVGPKGQKGYSGEQGELGQHGYDGVTGEKGEPGALGQPGGKGYTGKQGRKGSQGDPGDKGPRGVRGDLGNPGRRNVVPGPRGVKGEEGSQGDPGPEGIKGEPGDQGPPGDTDSCHKGLRGVTGEEGRRGRAGLAGEKGVQGEQGIRGPSGAKGMIGLLGVRGVQGAPGVLGSVGEIGVPGPKGIKGQAGDVGEAGDHGPVGTRGVTGDPGCDNRGSAGKKGHQGWSGGRGELGVQGDRGNAGTRGSKGAKGFQGRHGGPGGSGRPGERGISGPPGEVGTPGQRGAPTFQPCELAAIVRESCACYGKVDGAPLCPLYPTELVFILEMSATVTPAHFARMKSMVAALLQDLHISDSNCPVGARVALLVYAHSTSYLIRFPDFRSKRQLLQAVARLVQVRSAQRGRIASSMRFVAKNVFKRARQALLGRKVALFFTSGDSQAVDGVEKTVLQFEALGIIPTVVSFRRLPEVEKALEVNGMFRFIQLPEDDDYQDMVKLRDPIYRCTICFDFCQPGECLNKTVPNPLRLSMDLALLVDNSFSSPSVSAERVSDFLSAVLDGLKISPHPEQPDNTTRVSLLQTGPQRRTTTLWADLEEDPLEFGFTRYSSRQDMKQHIQGALRPRLSTLSLSHVMAWAVERGFPYDHPGRLRGILVVLTGDTNLWESETQAALARLVDCKAIVLFVLALGRSAAVKDEGVALDDGWLDMTPWKYHLLQLGLVQEPEMVYAKRMALAFFRRILVESERHPLAQADKDCEAEPLVPVSGTVAPSAPSTAGEMDTDATQSLFTDAPSSFGTVPPTHAGPTNSETTSAAAAGPSEVTPSLVTSPPAEATLDDSTAGTRVGTPEDTTDLPAGTTADTHCLLSVPALPDPRPDAPEEPCVLQKDAGTSCTDYSLKWYHEPSQGVCSRFWYRGCGGNANRFETEQECIQACIAKNHQRADPKEEKVLHPGVCAEQRDVGPCHSFLAKWFFNSTSSRCERFWYGGCSGNGNRFESRERCESTCATPSQHAVPLRLDIGRRRDD